MPKGYVVAHIRVEDDGGYEEFKKIRTSACNHSRPRHDQTDADELSLYNARITTALNSMTQGLFRRVRKRFGTCRKRYVT